MRLDPPDFERISVLIDEIDIANRIVHVHDRSGGRFQATFHDVDDILPIPAPLETWIAERHEYSWRLVTKLSTQDDTDALVLLSPGDRHLGATGNVFLDAERVYVKNDPVENMDVATKQWVLNQTLPSTVSFISIAKWGNE